MPKYVQPYYMSRNLKKEPNCRKLMGQIRGIMYANWFVNVKLEDKQKLLDYMREIERYNLLLRWERVREISKFTHDLNNTYNPKRNGR